MAPLITNGDRHWIQWWSPLVPMAMGCSIGAITSITIGANGSPLAPFFVTIGANGENPKSLWHYCQVRARVKVRGVRVRVGSRVDPDPNHIHNHNPNQLKLKTFFGELFASSPREFGRTPPAFASVRFVIVREQSAKAGRICASSQRTIVRRLYCPILYHKKRQDKGLQLIIWTKFVQPYPSLESVQTLHQRSSIFITILNHVAKC